MQDDAAQPPAAQPPDEDPEATQPLSMRAPEADAAAGQPPDTMATETLGRAEAMAGVAVPTPPDPERLGHFRIQRRLGAGGMGVVYLADDEQEGVQVALKLLRADLSSDPDYAQRFLREAGSAERVQHENVVRLMGAGKEGDCLYMALEFLSGGDLADLVDRRGCVTEAKACKSVRDAACGLKAIHAAGMVHRDIKPANLFVADDGRVLVGDLGLARRADGDDRMTMTGAAMGTPAYMAPEHVRGEADLDGRCDVYALGATLYKLLTGEEPFQGETLYVVTHQILTGEVPDPRRINGAISSTAAAIVRKAMSKEPKDRYQDMSELIEDLDCALAGRALLHAPVDSAPPTPVEEPAQRTMPLRPGLAKGGGAGLPRARGLSLPPGSRRIVLLVLLLGGLAYGLGQLPTLMVPDLDEVERPPWASDFGRDSHGWHADCSIAGVPVPFRWVPPRSSEQADAGAAAGPGGFWMCETECTQRLWQAVMGENPSRFSGPSRPVERVSYPAVQAFLEAVHEQQPELRPRLPSEAEWAYACRAGGDGPWGLVREGDEDGTAGRFAPEMLAEAWSRFDGETNYADTVGAALREHGDHPDWRPAPVRYSVGNFWGLYDLHGNVAEWCSDPWRPSPDATVQSGKRAVRGGSWMEPEEHAHCSARAGYNQGYAAAEIGFRFVIDVGDDDGDGDGDGDAD